MSAPKVTFPTVTLLFLAFSPIGCHQAATPPPAHAGAPSAAPTEPQDGGGAHEGDPPLSEGEDSPEENEDARSG